MQAPQTPCSQPAWVPLSRKFSRSASSSVLRGSTSAERIDAVDAQIDFHRAPSAGFGGGIGARLFERANAKRDRDAAAIGGAGMQIAHRIDIGRGGIDRFRHRCRIQPGANQRRHIEPQRPVADAADAERDLEAAAVIVERDLRCRGDERKIRAPRADLEKADADALVRPDRKPDRADAFALIDRGQHRPDEEIIRRHRRRADRRLPA